MKNLEGSQESPMLQAADREIVTIDGIKYSLGNGEAMISIQSSSLSGDVVISETVTYDGRDYTVTSAADRAFEQTGISSIKLPNSITSLGERCFYKCSRLTSVDMSTTGIPSLGLRCFSGCISLTSIDLPVSLITLDEYCFCGCSHLYSISLPSGITTLPNHSFSSCTGLTAIILPDGITSLGTCCFYKCSSLAYIDLPDSIYSLGGNCFAKCSSLSKITCNWNDLGAVWLWFNVFDGINPKCALCVPKGTKAMYEAKKPWSKFNYIFDQGDETAIDAEIATIDGIKYCLEDGEATILKQEKKLSGDIVIPETITYNGKSYTAKNVVEEAFAKTKISSIKLPNSIMELGDFCFYDCEKLISIDLPCSLTTLGEFCLYGCSSLTYIDLPDSITELKYKCFERCTSLACIDLPGSISALGKECFCHCYCLSKITCNWNDVDKVKTDFDLFDYNNKKCALCVPKGTKAMYEAKEPWSKFKYIFEQGDETAIDAEIATIDGIRYYLVNDEATILCQDESLSGDIVIPGIIIYHGRGYTIRDMTEDAFAGTRITSIELPDSITSLRVGCFEGCASLTSVNLPSTLESLGSCCFCDCISLTSIDLPDSIQFLSKTCFYKCPNLSNVTCKWTDLKKVRTQNTAFKLIHPDCTLYVPKGTKSMYEAKAPWCKFKNIVELDDETGVNSGSQTGAAVSSRNVVLSISGLAEGESVDIYDLSGRLLSSCTSSAGSVSFDTDGAHDTMVVKIGRKA